MRTCFSFFFPWPAVVLYRMHKQTQSTKKTMPRAIPAMPTILIVFCPSKQAAAPTKIKNEKIAKSGFATLQRRQIRCVIVTRRASRVPIAVASNPVQAESREAQVTAAPYKQCENHEGNAERQRSRKAHHSEEEKRRYKYKRKLTIAQRVRMCRTARVPADRSTERQGEMNSA